MKTLNLFPAQERNEQLVIVENGQTVTTSLRIAEYFGKAHKDVLKAIKALDCNELFRQRNFAPSCYSKQNGNISKSYPMYYLTRDGFTLLAMGFTGKKAMQFKIAYIEAFNEMEEVLRKSEQAKYAEKILTAEIRRFNKGLKEIAEKIRKQKGIEYGTYGDIQAGVFICDNLPLDKRLHNVFAQVHNAYVEAYTLSGKYINSEKQNRQLRKLLSEFGGKLVENFKIYPDI